MNRPELNALERSFVEASVQDADRERRSQRHANRRLRALLGGAIALLVVAVLAGVVALVQRHNVQMQALTSDAERIGAQAVTEQNVDRAMLFGVAAVKLQNRVETRSDLLAVLERNPALTHFRHLLSDPITAVDVSPDRRLAAVGDQQGEVHFLDLGTWKQTGAVVPVGTSVAPGAMSFSPDGRTLMVVTIFSSGSSLQAIDVAAHTASIVRTWSNANPYAEFGSNAVAYSPDGRSIVVSIVEEAVSDGTPTAAQLIMLDAATGRVRWQRPYPLRSRQEEPRVTFTPSGTLLTSAQHGDTILWDSRSGRMLRRYGIGGLPAVSADGGEVALGLSTPLSAPVSVSSVSVLDLRTGHRRSLAAQLSTAGIGGIAFSPDGSRIVADALDGVHVWDVASGAIDESFAGQQAQGSVMAVDRGATTALVGSFDGSLAAFDLSGRHRLGLTSTWGPPTESCIGASLAPCDAVDPHGDLLAETQSNGRVAIINLRSQRRVKMLPARGGVAQAVSFLPSGRTLVEGDSSGQVTLWDVATWRPLHTLHLPGAVQLTAPSTAGRLLAVETQSDADSNAHVAVMQLATNRVLRAYTLPEGSAGLQFTHDDRELVALGCCLEGSLVMSIDVHTGRALFQRGFAEGYDAAAVDPRSGMIALGGDKGDVRFLDPRTGRTVRPAAHVVHGNIATVAFSPDGGTLAVAGADNALVLWDLRTHEIFGTPFGPYPGAMPHPLFQRDGRLLVSLPEQAIQWPMDARTWERSACRVAGRDLTRAEWRDALPNRPYEAVCPALH